MNDVVERVARAICAEEQGGPLGYFPDGGPMRPGGVWHEYSEKQHNEWRAVARAAIEAMLSPTEAMMDAGRQAFLKDMRGRKLLKYLFEDDPSNVGAYGQLDAPIDLEVQRECATENVAKVLAAVFSAALADASPDIGKEGIGNDIR